MVGVSTRLIVLRYESFSWIQCQFHYGNAVTDPERDPRVPWIPPFRLSLTCKIELKASTKASSPELSKGTY